jgi:anti-sigma regulatory factor (Ser/Thr protein kinase)
VIENATVVETPASGRGVLPVTASPVVPAGGPEHDLLVVDSDEQLRSAAAAFLGEGRDGGDLMRASLPGWLVEELAPCLPEVTFAAAEQAVWRREPDLIGSIRKAAGECAPRRYRLLGLVTAPGGRAWDERRRCEAITNIAYAGQAVSILCVYDRRTAPGAALAAAAATHPHLRTGHARQVNPGYRDPRAYLDGLEVPEEPVQRTAPVLAVDAAPSLPELRHQLRAALRGRAGDRDTEEDFHLAVSEIAANAFRHGTPPVSARLWAVPDRLVCTITDAGTSYRDATAGYQPAHGDDLSRGGMGLWLARKLCDHVDLVRGPAGLTVRLVTALR